MIFLNTQMDLFILKADVEKFTSTNKKTLHLIFKGFMTEKNLLGFDGVVMILTIAVVSYWLVLCCDRSKTVINPSVQTSDVNDTSQVSQAHLHS